MVSAHQTARAPVLYPSPLNDARLARTRVAVEADGGLCLLTSHGREVLARPGQVLAVELVKDDAAAAAAGLSAKAVPSVLLRRTGAPTLALPVSSWLPDGLTLEEAGGGSSADLLDTIGVRSVVAALGRDDAWTFDAVHSGLERDGERPRVVEVNDAGPGRLRRIILAGRVVAVVFVVAWAGHGIFRTLVSDDSRPPLPWQPLALLAACAVALLAALMQARPHRTSEPVGAVAVTVLADGTIVGRDEAGDLVVVDATGRTGWLPGPGSGGVVTATALVADRPAPLHLMLASRDGTSLAEFSGSTLSGGTVDPLRELLERAGVVWQDKRSPRGAPATRELPSVARLEDRLLLREASFVTGAAGAMTALGALPNGHVVLGFLGLAVAGAAFTVARAGRADR